MSQYLFYQGSVYRLADAATDEELWFKRQRGYQSAYTKFQQQLLPHDRQLDELAAAAKQQFPDDVGKQRAVWMDQARSFKGVQYLTNTYGANFFQKTEPERELQRLLKADGKKAPGNRELVSERSRKQKLQELVDANNVKRADAVSVILNSLADFYVTGKPLELIFGKKSDQKVLNPKTNTGVYPWDTTIGLVGWWEGPKIGKQQTQHMNPLWARYPELQMLLEDMLPSSIILKTTVDSFLKEELSAFGNSVKDEIYKTTVMSNTLARWNDLVSVLNRDLNSSDELTRLTAMATSLVVHSGIRPGERGESFPGQDIDTLPETEILTDTGKVRTMGSAGLKASHLAILRRDKAQLEFVGKGGTTYLADLSDEDLIKALEQHVAQVTARGGGDIFRTSDGKRHVTNKSINEYIKEKLKLSGNAVPVVEEVDNGKWEVKKELPITAYAFRRLVATQTFYDSLRDRKPDLAVQLRKLKLGLVEDMTRVAVKEAKLRITYVVQEGLDKAMEDVRKILNHSEASAFRHAINNYVNHRVIIEYLSMSGVMRSMEEIVGEGYSVQIKFDPLDFFKKMMEEFPVAPETTAAVVAWMSKNPGTQSRGGTVVMRGPALFNFAPDALISWAENRSQKAVQVPQQLAAKVR
jgi:hypothetical protein